MSTIAILAVALYAGWAAAASLEPEQRPSSEQATRRLDADAYRGLLSAREQADKLTRNPQSVTATVDDSLPPLKHDDPRLTVPFHERLILIGACEVAVSSLTPPASARFQALWDDLTEQQKATLLEVAEAFVAGNGAAGEAQK